MPPIEMVAPEVESAATLFWVVVCCAIAAAGIRSWRRTRSPLYVLLLASGWLAVVNEPALDLLGKVWYPTIDQINLFSAFGISIPVWVAFAYAQFFGGLCIAIVVLLRRGITQRQWWAGWSFALFWNFLLETLFLRTDLYLYFGYQPLRVAGLPLYWPFINITGICLAATLIVSFPSMFAGSRVWLAAFALPVTQLAVVPVAMPMFVMMSQTDGKILQLVGLLTVGAFAIVAHGLYRLYEANFAHQTTDADRGDAAVRA